MVIPVTAGIRGFAGIPVPAKFHFFAGIPYRDLTLNLVIKTCQKIKIFQQKFDKKTSKISHRFQAKRRNFLHTINNETTQIINENRSKKLL